MRPAMKKGPAKGPLLIGFDLLRGSSDAQARHGDGRGKAEEQQERRGEAVEETFEVHERHDTHLSVGPHPVWETSPVRGVLI
jgi:hypothetical protein